MPSERKLSIRAKNKKEKTKKRINKDKKFCIYIFYAFLFSKLWNLSIYKPSVKINVPNIKLTRMKLRHFYILSFTLRQKSVK